MSSLHPPEIVCLQRFLCVNQNIEMRARACVPASDESRSDRFSVTLQTIPKVLVCFSFFILPRNDSHFSSDQYIIPVWSWWAVTCTAVISYFTYLSCWGQSLFFFFPLYVCLKRWLEKNDIVNNTTLMFNNYAQCQSSATGTIRIIDS